MITYMSALMMFLLVSGVQAQSLFEQEWRGKRCADSSCIAELDSHVVMRCVRTGDSVDVTMQQKSGTTTTRYAVDTVTTSHLRCHSAFTEGVEEGHPMQVRTVVDIMMHEDRVTLHSTVELNEDVGGEVVETENALTMHIWYFFQRPSKR